MIVDGVVVMVIGMGTVFTFLGIMVALMHLMAEVMKRVSVVAPADSGCSRNSEELAVVIAAARAYAEGKQK